MLCFRWEDRALSMTALKIRERPDLDHSSMVLGFSGWMDGGEVSTGAVSYLLGQLKTITVAEIEPVGFYIYNIPGSMETTALFRPHTRIEEGMITDYVLPRSVFHCSTEHRLLLFEGKEPNMNWDSYAECVFEVAAEMNVETIFFLGSFAGVVPHTRDPRLYSSASTPQMRDEMVSHGCRLSEYHGPAGIVTHLTSMATHRKVRMASIVAEIPAYVQGRNPFCIEVVLRKLLGILDIRIDLSALREESRTFRTQIGKMISEKEDLADMVHKLETDYDTDHLETEMGDLKQWLENQGFQIG
jgi:proteasome assembly chaperone (PAC2) family protein